jgi:hypothetical protein
VVERLDPGWNVDVILEACSMGMEMAEKLGDTSTRAYLMSLRAKNLAVWDGFSGHGAKKSQNGAGLAWVLSRMGRRTIQITHRA